MQNSLVFANSEGNPYPDSGISCVCTPPASVDPAFRIITVGYTNGVIRTFTLHQGRFLLREAQKPHANVSVKKVQYSPTARAICDIGRRFNSIFLQSATTCRGKCRGEENGDVLSRGISKTSRVSEAQL